MNTMKAQVSGTHCQSCSMLIEMSVGELDGVASVSADYASGIVTTTFDPARVSEDTVLEEIKSAGYGVQRLA